MLMGAPLETAFIFSYNPPRRGFQIDLQRPLEVKRFSLYLACKVNNLQKRMGPGELKQARS